MVKRRAAKEPERVLQPFGQRHEAFATEDHMGVFEAGIGEPEVIKQVIERLVNRQAAVMARHGVPIDRTVLADWMGRTGAAVAPVVDHMAKRLMSESARLYVDETTARCWIRDAARRKPGISGLFCATTAVGTDLRRREWCSIIGLGVRANMPQKSLMASTARSRSMPTVATRTLLRQTARAAIR